MTMYEEAGQWQPQSGSSVDRRIQGDNRLVTTLLVGRLISRDIDVVCRVRNISGNGARVESPLPLMRDDEVALELRGSDPIQARVAWAKEGVCGINFSAPVQSALLLKPPASTNGWQVRLPRLDAACPVLIGVDGYRIPATLRDINQRGMRVDGLDRMLPQGPMSVHIPDLGAIPVSIRWQLEDAAGLQCLTPFQFESLSTWLVNPDVRYSRRGDELPRQMTKIGRRHPAGPA